MGQIVGPPLFVYLVGEYGLKSTLLIWAGIQLHHFLCAIFMRPTHFYTKWTRSEQREAVKQGQQNDSNLEINITECHQPGSQYIRESKLDMATIEKKQLDKSAMFSSNEYRAKIFDKELLKNFQFILFNVAVFCLWMANMPIRGFIVLAHGGQIGLN